MLQAIATTDYRRCGRNGPSVSQSGGGKTGSPLTGRVITRSPPTARHEPTGSRRFRRHPLPDRRPDRDRLSRRLPVDGSDSRARARPGPEGVVRPACDGQRAGGPGQCGAAVTPPAAGFLVRQPELSSRRRRCRAHRQAQGASTHGAQRLRTHAAAADEDAVPFDKRRGRRPVAEPAGVAPAAGNAPPSNESDVVDRAVRPPSQLPANERIEALGEVQTQLLAGIVEERVRRSADDD